jgi:two-component system invasion response regulator UvrY
MIRVFIADDHAIVRRGVREILSEEADVVVVGEAASADELLRRAGKEKWDVLTLDLSLPGEGGLEVLKELRCLRPDLPVLILSIHSEEQFAVQALKTGAAGYLTKECAAEELVGAVRRVYDGVKYISPALAERLAHGLRSDAEKLRHEGLTEREYQVMCLLGSGKTVSAIAAQLDLSTKTVSTYRARVLAKMEMKTNAELMYYVTRHHLLP